MVLSITQTPSPNFDDRGDIAPDILLLHYTGMKSGPAALARLCDAASRVSAHYLVEEDGTIFQMVAEDKRAWHAGVSSWGGADNINARSVGVEIVNPGHEWGYRPFPDRQIDSVVALSREVCRRWQIRPARVLAHSDVAPLRKEDPGELFPWRRLAAAELALGPYEGPADAALDHGACLKMLGEIGYGVSEAGAVAALLAFQRRFCPAALGQGMSPLVKAAIADVHGRMAASGAAAPL
ncbi:MAG: N-acetylmuramoyl-L-alanine amidase [Pseudomonadota bacterium]